MGTLTFGFRHAVAQWAGVVLVLFWSVHSLFGQGQGVLNFTSVGATGDKLIWLGALGTTNGGVLATGAVYQVALYWASPTTFDERQFNQIGASVGFLTGNSAGTFFGGGRTITTPESSMNGPVLNFQVRGWKKQLGNAVFNTYEDAIGSGIPGIELGVGPIFSLKTKDVGGALETTPNLYQAPGYRGFVIGPGRGVQVAIQGEGAVMKSPDRLGYDLGEQITLTATPGRWHVFEGWGDGSTENPRLISVGDYNHYVAVFTATTALERVTFDGVSRLAPVGMPAIFVNGRFITDTDMTNVGATVISMQTTLSNGVMFLTMDGTPPNLLSSLYTGPFRIKGIVHLRAVAYGWDFSHAVETDPLTITVIPTYELSLNTPGGGHIQAPAGSIFPSNSVLTLAAVSDPGWTFMGWLGDLTGSAADAQITMNRNKCVRAVFGTSLGATLSGDGSVQVTPSVSLYPYGSSVRLFAAPGSGSSFVLWSNAATSTNNPFNFVVNNPTPTVNAVFQPLLAGQFALAVNSDGMGQVNVAPRGNRFASGQGVTLSASPNANQSFLEWSGDIGSTRNPVTVSMTQSRIITAHFTHRPRLMIDECTDAQTLGLVRFTVQGELGAVYEIERSGDLQEWTTLMTVTNSLGTLQWDVERTPLIASEFFRAHVQ